MEWSNQNAQRARAQTATGALAGARSTPTPGQRLLATLASWLPQRIPIAFKLGLAISLVVTLGMSVLGIVIIHNQAGLLERQLQTFGFTVVGQMAESAKEPLLANDRLQLNVLAANLAAGENMVGTVIYSDERRIVASAGVNPFQARAPFAGHSRPFLDGSMQQVSWDWVDSPAGSLQAISYISPVYFDDTVVGYALISVSREWLTESLRDSMRFIAIATLALIGMGILLSYFVGRRLSRPIHRLMSASQAFDSGHYEYRIPERRNDELGYLMSSFNSMAQGLLQKRQVEEALSRYVPDSVARRIVNRLQPVALGGQHARGSVLFVDIVDFTATSEKLTPDKVADLLNEFYAQVTFAASLFGGMIDKYIGDGAMVVFGVPERDDEHVFHSLACAVLLQRMAERVNLQRAQRDKAPVHYRVGVNTGDMLAGNIGSDERLQFTVVGDSVNLASRLCTVADAGQIVITEQTFLEPGVAQRIRADRQASIRIRGKSDPVNTYRVVDISDLHQQELMQAAVEDFINKD